MFTFCHVIGNTGTYFGTGIYVRYKKVKNNTITLVSQSPFHQLFSTPDRDLLITRDLHANNSYRPIDENWDELITFAPWSRTWRDFGIKAMLHNYVQYMSNPNATPRYRMPDRPKSDGMLILADSGGHQYSTNTFTGLIDPKILANWYNGTTDVGISLDIPVGENKDFWQRAAKVQKMNNKLMLDELNPNVDLMNALHGFTREEYNKYFDITHDDRIKRIGMGDFYRQTVLDAVLNIMGVLDDHPGMKQYHVLGILNSAYLLPIIRIATKRFKDYFITSDSSTPMQKALNWHYCIQDDHNSPLRSVDIGLKQDPPKKIFGADESSCLPVSSNRLLQCGCPVCSRIKYTDILGRLAGTAYYLMVYHNIFATNRYVESFKEYSEQMDDKQYKEVCRAHMKKNRNLDDTMTALDFIAETGNKQPKTDKYRYFFRATLFDAVNNIDDYSEHREISEKKLDKVLDMFERYHKGEKIDVKHKKQKKTLIKTDKRTKRKMVRRKK